MLLVFVSHFAAMYFLPAGAPGANRIAVHIALPSAPIFVLLSGMVLGVLARERGSRFPALRIKLLDRGLFLLGPAHFAILLAHRWVARGLGPGTRWVFMTDAIGVCLVVVPWIVRRIGGRGRVLIGALMVAASWCIYLGWQPEGAVADLVKAILVGDARQKGAVFALLPWMGAYVMATTVGEELVEWRRSGKPVVLRLILLGCACAAAGLILLFASRYGALAHQILPAGQKYPPGPTFLLGSAAVGCFAVAALAWLEGRGLFPRAFGVLTLLGRTSLVVFVLQYFVYYVGFFLLSLPWSPFWPVYFGLSVAFNIACAYLWDGYLGNRYLTLGLPRILPASTGAARRGP